MARKYLMDHMWSKLRVLLSPERGRRCRPSRNHRDIIEAIIWKLRSGAPWRDIPEEFCSWKTAYTRFFRWSRNGLLQEIFNKLKEDADNEWLMIDSTGIRAHQHAAGAKGGRNCRH